MNNQVKTETRTIEKPVDLLDRIIEETRDVGITYGAGGLEAGSFTGLCTLAKLIFESGAAPKSMDSSKKVLIAIAYGQTIGLNIWQSMKAIYIVNGMPSVWGRTVLALCRKNPDWVESGFDEYWEIKGERQDSHPAKFDDDSITAVCQTMRKGASKPVVKKFSVADAKRAGLWSNTSKLYGPYPQRLLPARALGYCLDDNFGDSLKGITIRETFDEEVDGKPPVSNVDELRNEIDKRKSNKIRDIQADQDKGMKVRPAEGAQTVIIESRPTGAPFPPLDGVGIVVSGSSNKVAVVEPTIASRAKQLDHDLSELDQARDWLKMVYEKIPMRLDHVAALKKASMEDGTWIDFSHIDSISDLEYLNRIAGRLEEMLSTIKKPGFTYNADALEAHTQEKIESIKAKA